MEEEWSMAVVHAVHEEVLGCKSVAFDEYAVARMTERNISEDDVLETLRPDWVANSTQALPVSEDIDWPIS